MPTKKRREDAEKRRKQREEDELAWAEFDATRAQLSPEEQAARRARWATVAADFDPDDWGCPAYRNVGLTVDEKTGEVCMHPDHGQGANRDREKIAAQDARKMARKWGRKNMWGKREWTVYIAKQERVSERTIQRYYKLTAK